MESLKWARSRTSTTSRLLRMLLLFTKYRLILSDITSYMTVSMITTDTVIHEPTIHCSNAKLSSPSCPINPKNCCSLRVAKLGLAAESPLAHQKTVPLATPMAGNQYSSPEEVIPVSAALAVLADLGLAMETAPET